MVKAPLLYRFVVNPLRRWIEDRRVEPHTFVQQWYRLWKPAEPTKVIPFLNLRISRSAKRKVA